MKKTNNKFFGLFCLTILVFTMLFGIRFIAEKYNGSAQQVYYNIQNCSNIENVSQTDKFVESPAQEIGFFDNFFQKKQDFCSNETKKSVFLGGFPLGISLNGTELIITSKVNVNTKDGLVCPTENLDIRPGDVLSKINGIDVKNISDVGNLINKSDNSTITITIKRNNSYNDYTINVATDLSTNNKKIGLLLQDKIAGIGTMTFIDPDNNRFAALGHPIFASDNQQVNGKIYNANIYGVKKGKKGTAGELQGEFNAKSKPIGDIVINNDYGIYGQYSAQYTNLTKIEVADREEIRPGKAQIYTTISGNTPKYYNIEIIKASNQSSPKTKSMVIRITDPELIKISGGIVQGMSGSPIIQNGKLVGAVTHVFLNDATKGYGLYCSWMFGN